MPNRSSIKILSVIAETLKRGDVGVLPTDTLYGIVGSALDKKAVQRIYALRKRNLKKPMIILIADLRDLSFFGIRPTAVTKKMMKKMWPGKVSIVFPQVKKYPYLHRGKHSLAFRLPRPQWLRALIRKTGPLVAPSANFEGKPPARNITVAKKYFGEKVQFYVDVGPLVSQPSTLIAIEAGKVRVIRAGAGVIDNK